MKAILIADIHIKLGQKNVPVAWQKNRFLMLAQEINKHSPEVVFIAGDLLDDTTPTLAETGLLYSFLRELQTPHLNEIILIPGNHEMENNKVSCYRHVLDMLSDMKVSLLEEFTTRYGIDFIPYGCIKTFKKSDRRSAWAITHVRGEIPPHVTPEIDLSVFSEYSVVFAGDLHAKSNSQLNILYPGSPMTTSFHRNELYGENGMYLIQDTSYEWIELKLPQLIRKKVSSQDEMVKTQYHHTIYELEGDLEGLANFTGNKELLDKKVTKDIGTPPTLMLTGDLVEELSVFLKNVKGIPDPTEYVAEFKAIIPND